MLLGFRTENCHYYMSAREGIVQAKKYLSQFLIHFHSFQYNLVKYEVRFVHQNFDKSKFCIVILWPRPLLLVKYDCSRL